MLDLKTITNSDFAVLGGSSVVFIKNIPTSELSKLVANEVLYDNTNYKIAIAADGEILAVSDDEDELVNWAETMNIGIVSLH